MILVVFGSVVMYLGYSLGDVLYRDLGIGPLPAGAKMKKMSNEELSNITGRTLLDMVSTTGSTNMEGTLDCGWYCDMKLDIDNTDLNFDRLELNTEITGNYVSGSNNAVAYIDGTFVGHYDDDGRYNNSWSGYCENSDGDCKGTGTSWFSGSGEGWDIDLGELSIGARDYPTPVIRGPYLELARRNGEVIGFRIGVQKIQGGATLDINKISAAIRGQDFNDFGWANCSAKRITGCNTGLMNGMELGCFPSESNCSAWGDGDAWTEDFWLSWQKEDVFWEFQNPAYEAGRGLSEHKFHTDGQGFWMHATDDIEGGL